jgi:hypothetical protein
MACAVRRGHLSLLPVSGRMQIVQHTLADDVEEMQGAKMAFRNVIWHRENQPLRGQKGSDRLRQVRTSTGGTRR